jgi:hypothetical protein
MLVLFILNFVGGVYNRHHKKLSQCHQTHTLSHAQSKTWGYFVKLGLDHFQYFVFDHVDNAVDRDGLPKCAQKAGGDAETRGT